MTVLYVAIGGAFGAVLRYAALMAMAFPWATMAVNVLGSLAMGAAFVLLPAKGLDTWQPLVMTGLLGGFTTFSAFSLDALKLAQAGQLAAALTYVTGTVILCLAGVTAGALLTKGLT